MADSKLRRILRKRQVGNTGKKSGLEVRDSVVRLVFENQDLKGVLAELGAKRNTEDDEQGDDNRQAHDFDANSVSSLLASFKYHSDLSGLPLSFVSAKKCSCLLLDLLTCTMGREALDSAGGIFCSSEQQERLDVLTKALTQLASNPAHFDKAHFMECIKDKLSFPLELIWILHKHSIVNFDLFIKSNLSNAAVYKKLTKDILCLVMGKFPAEKSGLAQKMISDLLTVMVNNAFPDENSTTSLLETSLREAYQLLVGTVFNGVFDHSLEEGDDSTLFLKISWLDVSGRSCNKFISSQLLNLLCYKPTWTVTQAITKQGTWTSAKTGGLLTQLFKELSSGLETKQKMDILRRTLEEEEVNWRTTLMFSSFMLHDAAEAKTQYRELLDYFLQEAFESIEQEGLISAFLLARQAASEGTHVFMAYEEWFQKTFCVSDHTLLSSKKEVTFFLSFLTNLVPLEPAQFLKVHVQRSSFIPSKYSVMLDDYITLAKTRLTDLKVPWDTTGIFKTKPADSGSGGTVNQAKNQVEADVTRAVGGFEQTGKIPSTVIQAIMFKRKYYHCYFLPTLLVPRMLPDIPDYKMKFIVALHEANKIPAEQYREYEQKCGEILNDLLEGAFSEDVVMVELLEPMDSLNADSEKLTEMVQSGQDEACLRRQLSAISDSLKTLTSGTQNCEGVVDLEGGVLDKQLVEIIDVLLASFCTGIPLPADRGGGAGHGLSRRWQELYVSMLAGHPLLHQTLFKRIWTVLVLKSSEETDVSHLDLSSLCAVLHSYQLQGKFPRVRTTRLVGHRTILEAVSYAQQHSTAEQMTNNLRFLYGALRTLLMNGYTCDASRADLIPPDVIHKFCYFINRLKHSSDYARKQCITEQSFEEILDFSDSSKFSEFERSLEKLSFSQWCSWELDVVPLMDILNDVERCNYQHYAVFSLFLPNLQPSKSVNIYWVACETIISAVMEMDNRVCADGCGGKCSSRREMVQLAAELLWMMPPEETIHSDKLDLISIFEDRCHTAGQGVDPMVLPSVIEGVVKSFFRLILCLPPVFLLVNHPSQSVQDNLIDLLVGLLETQREYLMEDPATLPLLLTTHIFQAVLSLSSARRSVDVVLGKLLRASPLVKVSILCHWSKLQPLMMRDTPKSEVLTQFDIACNWATTLISSQTSSMEKFPSGSELLAMALYHKLCQRRNWSLDDWQFACRQLDRIVCLQLSKVLVCHTAWSMLHQSGDSGFLNILISMLSQDNSLIIDVFRGPSVLEERVFHPRAVVLAPAVFFKCFEDNESAGWECVSSSSLLTVALECHCSIRNLYLEHQPMEQNSKKDSTEILSLERLTVYNDILRRMISISPPDAAGLIPDDLIRRCPPFVQSLLKVHPP